ncbi:DEAD/DEAH box helicase [Levilactobacillus bambusae]|uniref:DNA/RNA helicase n=1 Tax=Levilactobacillus bambusae TaxID=2024736 RepID=A0A2V1MZ23_9LACO|nr:helicase-related protein [Levilactobacillus bambusae]PWF99414.1 hypothetical protein DCM90_08150 [Levilactobacillus bambusae]
MQINDLRDLIGRQLLAADLTPELLERPEVQSRPAIKKTTSGWVCNRCGQQLTSQTRLPHQQMYCQHCIQLGRVSTLTKLYTIAENHTFRQSQTPILTWQGRLSPNQLAASNRVAANFQQTVPHLLWAVTGAGKTEMLFAGLAEAIQAGKRIGIASPRIDVILELAPRIQAAFAHSELTVLYGKSPEPYHYCQLTLCTTHQLLRFYRAFDVLVIDEVDSFPFAGNVGLHFAAEHALNASGALLYLTATPDTTLLRLAKQNRLRVTYLPLRYHGFLLPEIHRHLAFNWRKRLARGRLPQLVQRKIQQNVKHHQRFLLFLPRVTDLDPVESALNQLNLAGRFATVHAAHPNRADIVMRMRTEQLDFLVTTTILERGVTFPGIDVMVLGADDPVFSVAALVQIAGRVGRKPSRPGGQVDFFCHGMAQNVLGARRMIQQLNRRGQRMGGKAWVNA